LRTLVVIPAKNEEQALVATIGDLRAHAPAADLLVVDDGSTDRTGEVARGLGAQVLPLTLNLGIGGAVQAGLRWAVVHGYDCAVQFDGDGQHLAAEIPKLLARVEQGAELVVGSRFLDGASEFRSSAMRRVGIGWFAWLLSRITGRRITDPTSGFRATAGRALRQFAREYPLDYPEPEVLVICHRRSYKAEEVPVQMRERQGGSSSIRAFATAFYMVKVTLAILLALWREERK